VYATAKLTLQKQKLFRQSVAVSRLFSENYIRHTIDNEKITIKRQKVNKRQQKEIDHKVAP